MRPAPLTTPRAVSPPPRFAYFTRQMPLACRLPLRVLATALLAASAALPAASSAQDSTGTAALGIRGIGAFGVQAGWARVERGMDATDVAATIDLGHFASRRIRVGAEIAYLRSRAHREYVVAEDSTYRNHVYDLAGHVSLGFLLRDPARRLVPWLGLGVGVHALTSSFGSIPIDLRYNTNVFGLRAATGARLRLGRGSQRALVVEGNTILAKNVSRGGVRVGMEWLFGDLARR